jgi:hypothetical protein
MGNETITEDDEIMEPIFEGDSGLPCEVIITGEMVSTAAAKSLDENGGGEVVCRTRGR